VRSRTGFCERLGAVQFLCCRLLPTDRRLGRRRLLSVQYDPRHPLRVECHHCNAQSHEGILAPFDGDDGNVVL
jgi:hypothetical protein